VVANGDYGSLGIERAVRIHKPHSILKFQRQRGTEENFPCGAKLDYRLFLQSTGLRGNSRYADSDSHRRCVRKKMG
jgi:hypothetical protein